MTRNDFRTSSPWFAVAFVYFAVIVPASLPVFLDDEYTAKSKFLVGSGLAVTTAVIAGFAWRRLRGGQPGRHSG